MVPIWGPSGADRTQVGLMLAQWTLLSGISWCSHWDMYNFFLNNVFVHSFPAKYIWETLTEQWGITNSHDIHEMVKTYQIISSLTHWVRVTHVCATTQQKIDNKWYHSCPPPPPPKPPPHRYPNPSTPTPAPHTQTHTHIHTDTHTLHALQDPTLTICK